MAAFKLPKLEYLDISFNKIEKVNDGWVGHPSLKVFKSIDNKFKNLVPFKAMPKLEKLFLANNNIGTLTGCEGLEKLKFLHLRRNKIAKIEEEGLPELPSLEYLNLRSNQIPDLDNMHRLIEKYYESLRDLNVINCQVELD